MRKLILMLTDLNVTMILGGRFDHDHLEEDDRQQNDMHSGRLVNRKPLLNHVKGQINSSLMKYIKIQPLRYFLKMLEP